MAEGLVSVWAYPWDVARLGIDGAVQLLQDLGVQELSLATTYHSGQVLSLTKSEPRWITQESGPLIDLSDDQWRQGDLHFSPRTLVRDLSKALHAANMSLRGWTIVAHDKPGWDPVVNVFGDVLPHAPCPIANADRIRGLIASLANMEVFSALDLEALGFLPAVHGAHHDILGLKPTPLMQSLFSICFCDACEHTFSARLDWSSLRQAVRGGIGTLLAEELLSLDNFLLGRPVVGTFFEERSQYLNALLASWHETVKVPLVPILMATEQKASLSWIQGLDPNPTLWQEVIVLGYGDEATLQSDWEWLQEKGWDPKKIMIGQSLLPSVAETFDEARTRVELLLGLGARRFAFYNLGLLTPARLQWLHDLAAGIRDPG
ncbi:hypothetical protein [Sulfobacillus harzensis]|uniref:Uncharacterized protein n=1 Tax=Sulfobacillus harzensis TaxID=2729629 RepID=A0A7Y0L437_9FIRM|nr:hypothetical protein [Sulfobacillus harzensis]NMP22947.1 hypothetical protein [Sulfobacillus harzensis]